MEAWSCQFCTAMHNTDAACHGCGQEKSDWTNPPDPVKMAIGRKWLDEYSASVMRRIDAEVSYTRVLRRAGL